jgi:putative acetyltransferase
MKLSRVSSEHPDFISLISLLDQELTSINGDHDDFFKQYNKPVLDGAVVAYLNENPVGCGAIKKHSHDTGEIKRMYTKESARGMKVAATVLGELEAIAKELGLKFCILETAKALKPAVQLYQKSGYELTENYDQYKNIETSVCMKKSLF